MANNASIQSSASHSLEPRVARLETGLDILTRDVTNLAGIVREQGSNIEHEIQKLAVGVTQAAAPRKTDWQTILSGLMLIMAIGSAVFWPLNQTAQNNKTDIESVAADFKEHQKLNLHPVGSALLSRLEGQLISHIKDDEKVKEAMSKLWERNIDLLTERINARLNKLESNDIERNKGDLDELRALKLKVLTYHMGACPTSIGANGNGK